MLSLLLLVPLIGAVCVTLLPAGATADSTRRRAALLFGWAQLALLLWLGTSLDWSIGGVQQSEVYAWPLMVGIEFAVGVDGLSWLLLVVTALGFLLAGHRAQASRSHTAIDLLSLACMSAALASTNLLPMLAAWQLLLLLAYLRGHKQPNADDVHHGADPAAKRYLVISQAALAGLLFSTAVYFHASSLQGIQPSADIFDLQSQASSWRFLPLAENQFAFPLWTLSLQLVCCAALFGLFPFHLRSQPKPSAAAAADLTAAATKAADPLPQLIAGYALIRIVLPLAPDQVALAAPWMMVWGVGAGAHALLSQRGQPSGAISADGQATAPQWTAAIPALGFALFGLAAWTADQSAGAVLLDLGILVMVANVLALPLLGKQTQATTLIRALAGGPLVALVVLYFTSPGIEATLKIVRRTLTAEEMR